MTKTPAELASDARAVIGRVQRINASADEVLASPAALRAQAARQYQAVRAELVQQELIFMGLERLKVVSDGRLNLGSLEKAGYRNIAQIVNSTEFAMQSHPGVGPQTAQRARGAALQIKSAVEENLQVRLDPDRQSPAQTALVGTLHALELAEDDAAHLDASISDFQAATAPLVADAARASSRVRMFFSGRARKDAAIEAAEALSGVMAGDVARTFESDVASASRRVANPEQRPEVLWADYRLRSVEYWGLLGEIADLDLDVDAAQGFVPSEIVDRVNQQQLDDSLLTVSLRGYQAFGARFALVQRRTILGDEMGLGKTIEALAAVAHLRALDNKHFLVVCPASVLVNWTQEIERRTHRSLRCYRLHGPERHHMHKAWLEREGIAVTTFGSLGTLPLPGEGEVMPAMIIVDEAHYVKNRAAKRSKAVRAWTDAADRVLFMTGTPMENRVEEFQTLVGYLQPEVAKAVSGADGVAGPMAFRKAVAPAYLRRNQADVLSELPERVDMEDWVEFGGPDSAAYRDAVISGNFMAMRQAAYAPGTPEGSAKLARMLEIIEESAQNGWKVVVFSFFRGVLDRVERAVGPAAVGQLTGSVTPSQRQALVEEFTAIDGHAVLVSQIEAGGVGLNIQAGSVVILAEPQWKPSTEDQAIARCHRMGQTRVVNVHRLLAENSVDQRMLDVVRQKALLFDEYVRNSDVKDASPSAVDITDVETARRLATMSGPEVEREVVRLERERLGIDDDADEVAPDAPAAPSGRY